MTSEDEIARLRSELHMLNCHIQAERNDEVRHGLQKIRLEAGRAQLLVQLMDAMVSGLKPAEPVAVEQAPTPPPADDEPVRRKLKPDGIPSVTTTVKVAIRQAGVGLQPKQVTEFIRDKWWPDVPPVRIQTSMWTVAQNGHLEKDGRVYKLNGRGSH